MSAPLIYVDLIRDDPMTKDEFRQHAVITNATWPQGELDAEYMKYINRFQPWRLLILSGDNHEPMFRSTERYFNRADALHAAELAFGSGSNVYLREAEHGNVVLRLAVSTPADDILDAINAPDLDLAIDAAEDAAKDGGGCQ